MHDILLGFDNMTIEERVTLCSLITEATGMIGFVPTDDVTADFYKKYVNETIEPVVADSDAKYADEIIRRKVGKAAVSAAG